MFTEPTAPPAFIATLGLQPQVITRGLDSLLSIEPGIERGIIIHTRSYRSHPDWPPFETFQRYIEAHYATIDWQWIPIQEESQEPLADVDTPDSAELAFKIIFNTTKNLKREGFRLHNLIAGGRKSIIVYSMVSAQLIFDVEDKLWHIFSDDEHNRGLNTRPHPPPTVQLVEIPILHLAGLMPMVRELILHSDDPTRALHLYREHEDVERNIHMLRFLREECDVIDRRIMWLYVKDHSNQQIAQRVSLSAPGRIAAPRQHRRSLLRATRY